LTKLFPVTLYAKQDSGRFLSPFSSLQTTHQLCPRSAPRKDGGGSGHLPNPHGEEARSAVSNHESPTVSAAILRDASLRDAPQDEVCGCCNQASPIPPYVRRPP
jgi:hypothetical protein